MARKTKQTIRCQALDSDGRLCRKLATHIERYHGENELYSDKVGWVNVNFCDAHTCFPLEKVRRLAPEERTR